MQAMLLQSTSSLADVSVLDDDSLLQVVRQTALEERYNHRHIDAKLDDYLFRTGPHAEDLLGLVAAGADLLHDFLRCDPVPYRAKQERLAPYYALAQRDSDFLPALVKDLFIGLAYYYAPHLLTAVTAQLAARVQGQVKEALKRIKEADGLTEGNAADLSLPTVPINPEEAITLTAELLALLCQTDVFDIVKPNRQASLTIQFQVTLPELLIDFIEGCEYLPPMVCRPLEVTHNYASGYLTHNDSLILSSGNHHDGDLCLDVINKVNGVALTLNTAFLSSVEEEPKGAFTDPRDRDQWLKFKARSHRFYKEMVRCDNQFYLTHKVDKRGRLYACGYHISTQGAPYKKAMIDFARKELVEGVPTQGLPTP